MSDHFVEMISNLAILLTLVVGIWNSTRIAKQAVGQSQANGTKIQELHSAVNGVLSAAKTETMLASDRLLEVSTTAARAEGKADAIAAVTEKSRSVS